MTASSFHSFPVALMGFLLGVILTYYVMQQSQTADSSTSSAKELAQRLRAPPSNFLADFISRDECSLELEEQQGRFLQSIVDDACEPLPSYCLSPTPAPTSQATCPVNPCPADVELVGQIGYSNYTQPPILLVSQQNDYIEYKVLNTFGQRVEGMYTQFHADQFGDSTCVKALNLTACTADRTYKAYCMSGRSITLIDLWFIDENILDIRDKAVIPKCCDNTTTTGDVVQYTFMVHCDTKCAV